MSAPTELASLDGEAGTIEQRVRVEHALAHTGLRSRGATAVLLGGAMAGVLVVTTTLMLLLSSPDPAADPPVPVPGSPGVDVSEDGPGAPTSIVTLPPFGGAGGGTVEPDAPPSATPDTPATLPPFGGGGVAGPPDG